MKKKFLTIFSIVFVLAFAAAVYAFNQSTNPSKTTASCCAKKDSCPLKNKSAAATEKNSTVSCCDKADCCCKSGACPMKSSGEKEAADCCGNCCGGSCPMKDKQTETSMVQTKDASCPHNQTAGS
jgi:hypothetical protein